MTEQQEGYVSPGAALIAAERQRQIALAGWMAKHDDGHVGGELVDAAMSYASLTTMDDSGEWGLRNWPWDEESFKPSDDQMFNLVRAGALIAAEIDRMIRANDRPRAEGTPDRDETPHPKVRDLVAALEESLVAAKAAQKARAEGSRSDGND